MHFHPDANMLPNENPDLYYLVALSQIEGIGSITARNLLQHFTTAEAIFKASAKSLKNIEGVGEYKAKLFNIESVKEETEKQLQFAAKHNVQILHLNHPDYPKRLLQCNDAPLLLYYKGNADLNTAKVCAIVGTRKSTDYGQRCTEDLLSSLEGTPDLLITSGLALGIDTIAHKVSLKHNLATVGVLGHGLDYMYPASNRALAKEMTQNGGLLTEFTTTTKPSPKHFPVRNRIVAGMSDITIIVESDIKGGAMITAYVAASYNRELAAFPGRIYDARSEGPNHLIKQNMAAMITGADDLLKLMNWDRNTESKKAVQKQLFQALSVEENKLVTLLQGKDSIHTDELMLQTGFSYPQLASLLLQLEMQDLIKTLPGKMYRLN